MMINKTTFFTVNSLYKLKFYSLAACFLLLFGDAMAQLSNTYNYVLARSIKKVGVTDVSQISGLTLPDLKQTVSYLDGRGRLMQEIQIKASSSQQDVVWFTSYDNLGRRAFNYLPYASGNTGAFKSTATAAQASFYQSLKSDNRAFSETKYENSPQSRVTEVVPEGAEWLAANKKQTVTYGTNAATEIRLWTFNVNTKTASTVAYYAANALKKTVYKDEDDFLNIEYADKSGKVLCMQNGKLGSTLNVTHYIYDDFGNLRFIVPPEADANLPSVSYSVTFNDNFCQKWLFAFEYDNQFRQASKSSPGGGTTYLVYDPLNRVILAQDPKNRISNQWIFSKYDIFGRPIMTGIYRHSAALSQSQMQSLVDDYYLLDGSRKPFETRSNSDFSACHGYSNQSFPVMPSPNNQYGQPFQVSYFDDYDFDFNGTQYETTKGEPAYVNFGGIFSSSFASDIRGRASGNRVLVLGTSTWLASGIFYDNDGRPIQIQNENYSTGARNIEVTSLLYDFSGQLLNSERRHRNLVSDNSFALSLKERLTYDHDGRLFEKYVSVNDEPEERVKSYTYNDIGETQKKLISNAAGLQSLDYKYNTRGWLSNINGNSGETGPSDFFTEQLAYNNPFYPGSGFFDGKIKQSKWKNDLSSKERLFDYSYDAQNRLTSAAYKMNSGAGWISDTDLFTENNITYDRNGNIKTLDRYSGSLSSNKIDGLTYNYGPGGNQLMSVTDAAAINYKDQGFKDGNATGDDYAYDAAGNLSMDLNKQIQSITYNVVNLLDRITFANGSYIQYTYTSGGEKLSQLYFNAINSTQKKFDYQAGFVYEDGVLQILSHDEGRIVPASYTNLITNTATAQAGTQEGFVASGAVSLSNEVIAGQTYIKAVCNQSSGTPGIQPIGGLFNVKAGERYAFKVLGFQSVGTDAKIVVRNNSTDADIVSGSTITVGQTNETWVTTTFTVPSGVTQIKLGILWPSAAINKAFYVNELKLYKLDYEYQYFVNDHLGTPRAVLQTNPSTFTFTATMESENFQTESSQFFNLRSTNEILFSGANFTPGGNEALSMNANYRVGPSRSFKVFPGDLVDASVMAYYVSGTYSKTPLATMGTYVVAALTGSAAPAVDGINYSYSASGTANPSFILSPNQGNTKPSAFLNYILFDDAYRPIEAKSAPLGANAGVLHQVLLPTIAVKEAGYLFVYLSYDNDAGSDVFFDDLKIIYKESPLIQIYNNYPFGMTAYNWVRDGESQNRYLYQSKEYDENSQLQDFNLRQYDGSIGRWLSADPKGDVMAYNTPYASMMNNPSSYIDPNGDCPICVAVIAGAVIGAASSAVVYTATALAADNFSWKNFGKSVAFGAVAGAVGGGIGGVFAESAFAQTTAFSIINTTASTVAGAAIVNGDVTWGTVVGGLVGGTLGSAIPQFSGVKGGALANIGAELSYSAIRGGIIGSITGGVGALVDKSDVRKGIDQGIVNGAIGGAAMAAINIAALGPAYVPDQKYGDFGKLNNPVYRRGTLLTRSLFGEGSGVTIGRNLVTHQWKGDPEYYGHKYDGAQANNFLRAHETAHYKQEIRYGFARFYARTIAQYIKLGASNTYGTFGTLEFMANYYAFKMFGEQFILKE